MLKKLLVLFFTIVLVCNSITAQNDSINKKRLTTVFIGESVSITASLIGLNSLWYKDYPRSKFHFFNDNKEWFGMDKLGHFTTTYHIGKIGYDIYQWTGIENKKAIWYGGTTGLIYLTTIEILDAFSTEWGFSWGDMIANTTGAALFMGQEFAWNEQRILIKYSFMPSKYAEYRPELLGKNTMQQSLKDYNGQTYWLSVNPYSFLSKDSKFPKFLNFAFGYGADGMIGARENPIATSPDFKRYRQFYFSFDLDLSRIPCKRKWIKTVLSTLNIIKIPFPSLEYNTEQGIRFHPLYF